MDRVHQILNVFLIIPQQLTNDLIVTVERIFRPSIIPFY